MNSPHLSIILPAYNEEHRVSKYINSICTYFDSKKIHYELIVVNDGSTDNTSSVVQGFRKKYPQICEVGYEENKGKGYAVKVGINTSRGEYCLVADADGSVSIDHYDMFMRAIVEGNDLVIGSIELPNKERHIIEHNQWYRRVLGSLSKKLIRYTATPGIYDTQRGFKLYKRSIAQEIFNQITIDRWGFDIESIVIAQLYGRRIKEIQVKWNNPKSFNVGLRAYIKTLLELVEIVLKRVFGYYSLRRRRFIVTNPQKIGATIK